MNYELCTFEIGTFQARSEDVHHAVNHALDCGYIHIDTAAIYRNEQDIGDTLKHRGVKREEVFITSKIPPTALSYEGTKHSCLTSLADLQTDYVDLMLIHWPAKSGIKKESPENATCRKEAWKALEELHDQGKCKAIGVSNYTITHLEQMKTYWRIKPVVNQVECHPYLVQNELRNWCKSNDIFVEAYSSLGQGELLKDEEVLKIASKHKKTPAQVLLRWGLQQNMVIIPKSVTEVRIKSNIELYNFSLEEKDMHTLNMLDRNRHICWDPTDVQ
eukprot:Phypoly_transcript_13274.p1 GENE.Phypoly_transcript_13274~~Phypoly_transcript_13274.p1  ORF type:complete len:274 (+),score=23.60 Phypoly_transcript_13274:80-901(+)